MEHRVALVLTTHTKLGDTGRPTGFWYEELAAPFYTFVDAGHAVEVFVVGPGAAEPDPLSLTAEGGRGPIVDRFLNDPIAIGKLQNAQGLDALSRTSFDAIFLVGGHGAMWDFPTSRTLCAVVGDYFDRGAVVAAVCHGPAGLLEARGASGAPIAKGRQATGFTNAEEEAVGLTAVVPFLLEDRLREAGAIFQNKAPFCAHAVRDGNLVTGQNPQSSALAAQLVLEGLRHA